MLHQLIHRVGWGGVGMVWVGEGWRVAGMGGVGGVDGNRMW